MLTPADSYSLRSLLCQFHSQDIIFHSECVTSFMRRMCTSSFQRAGSLLFITFPPTTINVNNRTQRPNVWDHTLIIQSGSCSFLPCGSQGLQSASKCCFLPALNSESETVFSMISRGFAWRHPSGWTASCCPGNRKITGENWFQSRVAPDTDHNDSGLRPRKFPSRGRDSDTPQGSATRAW